MQYTMFGNTGMKVSRLCLGAMTFPNKLSTDESQRIIDEALDNGVNFVDTADSYRESEEVLGQILDTERRERVFLATKVFRRYCRDDRVGRNSRVNILNSLHRSLRLLNTDYVDLYQLHHPDPETPAEETMETLDTLVKQGKIRYWGVSNHYAWQMSYMIADCLAARRQPMVSYQANYSLMDRQIELEAVPFMERFNVAMMCYSPLSGGILTGKYHDQEGIPEGSRADKSKRMTAEIEDERTKALVDYLKQVESDLGHAPNQTAILWLLAKPYATTVIMGGSKPEHFQSLYEIADETLPAEVVEKLDELSDWGKWKPFRNQAQRPGARLIGQGM